MNTFQANGHNELKKVLTQTFKAQTKTEKATTKQRFKAQLKKSVVLTYFLSMKTQKSTPQKLFFLNWLVKYL